MKDPAAFVSATAPGYAGWRTTILALGCAFVIGAVGGLIGLGGGEFRLPILVGLLGFAVRAAVPMNQMLSLVTLVTALSMRWHAGLLAEVAAFGPAVLALAIGGVTAAWLAARLVARISEQRLERAVAALLMAIGLLLIGEQFLPAGLPALLPDAVGAHLVAGFLLGLGIGTAATFLGVAGGELLIPTLIFVFGADIRTAGSAALLIAIPTVCAGLLRFVRIGAVPDRAILLRIGLPMGAESLVGAAVGAAFAMSVPTEALKLLLGLILIGAALRAFRKHQ